MGARRRPQGASDDRDSFLPFLTHAQASRVRFLMRQALAEHGREAIIHPEHLLDDQGGEFGLWNAAVLCHSDPRGESAWPLIVEDHVRKLLNAIKHEPAVLTGREMMSRVYVRLFPTDALASAEGEAYLGETVPGLVNTLVLDSPDTLRSLGDCEIARFGGTAVLHDAAMSNLRALPMKDRKQVSTPDGASLELFLGESVYTASRALIIEEFLRDSLTSVDLRWVRLCWSDCHLTANYWFATCCPV
jgi:hypothetical protein